MPNASSKLINLCTQRNHSDGIRNGVTIAWILSPLRHCLNLSCTTSIQIYCISSSAEKTLSTCPHIYRMRYGVFFSTSPSHSTRTNQMYSHSRSGCPEASGDSVILFCTFSWFRTYLFEMITKNKNGRRIRKIYFQVRGSIS